MSHPPAHRPESRPPASRLNQLPQPATGPAITSPVRCRALLLTIFESDLLLRLVYMPTDLHLSGQLSAICPCAGGHGPMKLPATTDGVRCSQSRVWQTDVSLSR